MPRLVLPSEVAAWQDDVRRALERLATKQRASMTTAMAAAGVKWSSPVGEATSTVWSQPAWAKLVEDEFAPEAERIAREIVTTLRGRVTSRRVTNGLTTSKTVPQMAGMLVDRVISYGEVIGAKLNPGGLTAAGGNPKSIAAALDDASKVLNGPGPRYGGVTHPDARPTNLDEFQSRFAELDRLASRVAGHMSDMAQQLLAQTAADAGPGISYTWNAVGDDNTRADHLDADGQSQPAGQPFDVGGEPLMYPGDPSGSDEQIDNCRCWLEVEGVDVADSYDPSADDTEQADATE